MIEHRLKSNVIKSGIAVLAMVGLIGCEADDPQKECSSSEAVYNYCSDYQGKYKCTGNEQCKCYESKDDPCECGCKHYGNVKEGWEGTK